MRESTTPVAFCYTTRAE